MRAMVKLHKYAKYAAILYIEIYIKHQFINYVTILKLLFVGHPLGFYNNKLTKSNLLLFLSGFSSLWALTFIACS